ncbi:retron St85 family effector protein, partial [Yersinia enterocolitica]
MRKEIQTIIPKISDKHLDSSVEKIRDLILNDVDDTKKVIFLCGKDKSDKDSYRAKIASFLEKEKGYQLAFPEDLFEDLLEGQGGHSLLSLEKQLAEAVDLIVLIPESPGSFAELGAFSMKAELAQKMLILRLSKFKSGKSFINHGPIRLVKSTKGQVLDIPNDFNAKDPTHTELVLSKIKNMLSTKRKKK